MTLHVLKQSTLVRMVIFRIIVMKEIQSMIRICMINILMILRVKRLF